MERVGCFKDAKRDSEVRGEGGRGSEFGQSRVTFIALLARARVRSMVLCALLIWKEGITGWHLLIVYNKPLRICLLLVLRSSVDGLDAISTPINIKYGAEVIVQIHNGGNSKDVQGFCTLLEFVLQRHLWELQGFRGLP